MANIHSISIELMKPYIRIVVIHSALKLPASRFSLRFFFPNKRKGKTKQKKKENNMNGHGHGHMQFCRQNDGCVNLFKRLPANPPSYHKSNFIIMLPVNVLYGIMEPIVFFFVFRAYFIIFKMMCRNITKIL